MRLALTSTPKTRAALSPKICSFTGRVSGAYALVVMDEQRVIGVRDPNGFRPLCLGKIEEGWVLASETAALDVVGAHFVREIDPGEMIVIDATGWRSRRPFPAAERL